MSVEVRPCSALEELNDALVAIGYALYRVEQGWPHGSSTGR